MRVCLSLVEETEIVLTNFLNRTAQALGNSFTKVKIFDFSTYFLSFVECFLCR